MVASKRFLIAAFRIPGFSTPVLCAQDFNLGDLPSKADVEQPPRILGLSAGHGFFSGASFAPTLKEYILAGNHFEFKHYYK